MDKDRETTTLLHRLNETLGSVYGFERELGGGGLSRVFVTVERRYERRVVVKVLTSELAAGVSAERFAREVQLAARLQQANIVPVFASGQIEGLPYNTMPRVEGESQRTRLDARGALPVSEPVAVIADVQDVAGAGVGTTEDPDVGGRQLQSRRDTARSSDAGSSKRDSWGLGRSITRNDSTSS